MYVGESYTQVAIVKDKEGIRNDVKPNYSSSNVRLQRLLKLTRRVLLRLNLKRRLRK